jgi:hypothetical protein
VVKQMVASGVMLSSIVLVFFSLIILSVQCQSLEDQKQDKIGNIIFNQIVTITMKRTVR